MPFRLKMSLVPLQKTVWAPNRTMRYHAKIGGRSAA